MRRSVAFIMKHSRQSENPCPAVNLVATAWRTYLLIDEQNLRNELHALYNNRLFHKPPGELVWLLIEDDLQGTISEVYKLLLCTGKQSSTFPV